VIGKYRAEIEYDLRAQLPGTDLGELWRSRRWRLLLNLIDHLPRNSYYAQAVANDEEHARMLLESMQGEKSDHSPALSTWTQEAAILADLVDAVNALQHTLIAVNSTKGAGKPKDPYPRPKTAIDRVRRQVRQERHEALANRMLSRRRTANSPVRSSQQ
jgi:hypothetical protein